MDDEPDPTRRKARATHEARSSNADSTKSETLRDLRALRV